MTCIAMQGGLLSRLTGPEARESTEAVCTLSPLSKKKATDPEGVRMELLSCPGLKTSTVPGGPLQGIFTGRLNKPEIDAQR